MMEVKQSPNPSQMEFRDLLGSPANGKIEKTTENVVDSFKQKIDNVIGGITTANDVLKTLKNIKSTNCSANNDDTFSNDRLSQKKEIAHLKNGNVSAIPTNEIDDETNQRSFVCSPSHDQNKSDDEQIENLSSPLLLQISDNEDELSNCDINEVKKEEDKNTNIINVAANNVDCAKKEDNTDRIDENTSDQPRDPGDDLDTLLSKINDLVGDCITTKEGEVIKGGGGGSPTASLSQPTNAEKSCTEDNAIVLDNKENETTSAPIDKELINDETVLEEKGTDEEKNDLVDLEERESDDKSSTVEQKETAIDKSKFGTTATIPDTANDVLLMDIDNVLSTDDIDDKKSDKFVENETEIKELTTSAEDGVDPSDNNSNKSPLRTTSSDVDLEETTEKSNIDSSKKIIEKEMFSDNEQIVAHAATTKEIVEKTSSLPLPSQKETIKPSFSMESDDQIDLTLDDEENDEKNDEQEEIQLKKKLSEVPQISGESDVNKDNKEKLDEKEIDGDKGVKVATVNHDSQEKGDVKNNDTVDITEVTDISSTSTATKTATNYHDLDDDDDDDDDVVILDDDDDDLLEEDIAKTASERNSNNKKATKSEDDVSLDEISDESLDDDSLKKISDCSLDAISNDAIEKSIIENAEPNSALINKSIEKKIVENERNEKNENSFDFDNSDNACDDFENSATIVHEGDSNKLTDSGEDCSKKSDNVVVVALTATSNSYGSSSNLLKEAQSVETNNKTTEPISKNVQNNGETQDNLQLENKLTPEDKSSETGTEITTNESNLEIDDSSKMEIDDEVNDNMESEANKDESKIKDSTLELPSESNLQVEIEMLPNSSNSDTAAGDEINKIDNAEKDIDTASEKPASKRIRLSADEAIEIVEETETKENEKDISTDIEIIETNSSCETQVASDIASSNITNTNTTTFTASTVSRKRSHSPQTNTDEPTSNDDSISSSSPDKKKSKTDEDVILVVTPSDDVLSKKDEMAIKKDDDSSSDLLEDKKKVSSMNLYPPPKFSDLPVENFNLEFLKRFKKSIGKMTKDDLEELVLEKIVEAIVHKSEFSEMRDLLEKQEKIITAHRTKISELSKQFRDLEMVHNRVLKDLEMKNSQFIMPVKITRAVGLQVFIPHKKTDGGGGVGAGGLFTSNATSSSGVQQPAHLTRSMTAANSTTEFAGGIASQHVTSSTSAASNSYIRATNVLPVAPTVAAAAVVAQQTQRRGCVQKLTPMRPDTPQNITTANQRFGSAAGAGVAAAATVASTGINAQNSNANAVAMSNQSGMATSNMKILNKSISFTRNRLTPSQNGSSGVGYQPQSQAQVQATLSKGLLSSSAINVVRKSQVSSVVGVSPGSGGLNSIRNLPQKTSTESSSVLAQTTRMGMSRRSVEGSQNNSITSASQSTNHLTASLSIENASVAAQMLSSMLPSTPTTAKAKIKSVIDLTDEDDGLVTTTTSSSLPPTTTIMRRVFSSSPLINNNSNLQHSSSPSSSSPSISTNHQLPAALTKQFFNKVSSYAQQVARQQQQSPSSSSTVYGNIRQQQQHQQQNGNTTATATVGNSLPPSTSITRFRVGNGSTTITSSSKQNHPAPLPLQPTYSLNAAWKLPPPRPTIHIDNRANGIVISWTMGDGLDRYAECTSYQIYAYQEIAGPATVESWRHVGDVKAMLLPMAVTLTQFQEGQRYYFAVRAIDTHARYGPFSLPKTWS